MTIEEYYKKVPHTQRVYKAERETLFWMKSEKFVARDDAWSFLCAIHDTTLYRKKIRVPLPLLKFVEPSTEWEARYMMHPEYLAPIIEMGSGRTVAVLLHELSHHIAIAHYGVEGWGHKRIFTGTYLRLVCHFYSKVAAQDLQASFDRHKVDYV